MSDRTSGGRCEYKRCWSSHEDKRVSCSVHSVLLRTGRPDKGTFEERRSGLMTSLWVSALSVAWLQQDEGPAEGPVCVLDGC